MENQTTYTNKEELAERIGMFQAAEVYYRKGTYKVVDTDGVEVKVRFISETKVRVSELD